LYPDWGEGTHRAAPRPTITRGAGT
jgi:hypothetical protein